MADIRSPLGRIDALLAAHETGGAFADIDLSKDPMRWTGDPGTAPAPEPGLFDDAEIIHAYTRAQAIVDGELVDVSTTAREAGFRYPVALTRAAWENCVAWTEADNDRKGCLQDEAGRLWDVLWMASRAAKAGAGGSQVRFSLVRVARIGRDVQPRRVELVAVCGPGDDGEPVVTIMQPDEHRGGES